MLPYKNFLLSIFLILALFACVQEDARIKPSATITLQAFLTSTASKALAGTSTPQTSERTPEPTPTPLVHIIEEGDTLLVVANRYGKTLDELLVANPGINPRFLSIGESLIIPGEEGGTQGAILPTPTPLPLRLSDVQCFNTQDGGNWCLTDARYPGDQTIENIVVRLDLRDSLGEVLDTTLVYAPLNLLSPGEIAPLAAYFAHPVPDYESASAMLVGAVINSDIEERYAQLNLEIQTSNPAQDMLSWEVNGGVQFDDFEEDIQYRVAVVVVALDDSDRVIGYVKWEPAVEDVESFIDFSTTVYSLGPEIESVAIYAEGLKVP